MYFACGLFPAKFGSSSKYPVSTYAFASMLFAEKFGLVEVEQLFTQVTPLWSLRLQPSAPSHLRRNRVGAMSDVEVIKL